MRENHPDKFKYTYEEALEFLTDRQIRVLKLIAKGHTCRELAVILHISEETAYTHRRNIKKALELNGHKSLEQWCWANHNAMFEADPDQ